MRILEMILQRGELTRFTFDVYRVTVQNYMLIIPRKLHSLVYFKEYFDKILTSVFRNGISKL